ncbi:MAG: hypothetical protein Q9M91_05330 [Candidatus Dojkabacteria bacterium]|nr:hypothetical protein [Candidatus Dojkabacteria bacterium]
MANLFVISFLSNAEISVIRSYWKLLSILSLVTSHKFSFPANNFSDVSENSFVLGNEVGNDVGIFRRESFSEIAAG